MMIFFSGYFSVSDKLYCEKDARAAKASENVSQRIPMNTQQVRPFLYQTNLTIKFIRQMHRYFL